MVLSGRFAVQMDDDGRGEVYGAGDIGIIPSGHDAWVEGDEPVVAIDMQVLSNEPSHDNTFDIQAHDYNS